MEHNFQAKKIEKDFNRMVLNDENPMDNFVPTPSPAIRMKSFPNESSFPTNYPTFYDMGSCVDDPLFRTKQGGMSCVDILYLALSLPCEAMGLLRFTKEEVNEILEKCPRNCNTCTDEIGIKKKKLRLEDPVEISKLPIESRNVSPAFNTDHSANYSPPTSSLTPSEKPTYILPESPLIPPFLRSGSTKYPSLLSSSQKTSAVLNLDEAGKVLLYPSKVPLTTYARPSRHTVNISTSPTPEPLQKNSNESAEIIAPRASDVTASESDLKMTSSEISETRLRPSHYDGAVSRRSPIESLAAILSLVLLAYIFISKLKKSLGARTVFKDLKLQNAEETCMNRDNKEVVDHKPADIQPNHSEHQISITENKNEVVLDGSSEQISVTENKHEAVLDSHRSHLQTQYIQVRSTALMRVEFMPDSVHATCCG